MNVTPPPYLTQFIDQLLADPALGKLLAAPSVSYGSTDLYGRGVFEADTRPNLARRLTELLGGPEAAEGAVLTVNDKKLRGPLRVRLRLGSDMSG